MISVSSFRRDTLGTSLGRIRNFLISNIDFFDYVTNVCTCSTPLYLKGRVGVLLGIYYK